MSYKPTSIDYPDDVDLNPLTIGGIDYRELAYRTDVGTAAAVQNIFGYDSINDTWRKVLVDDQGRIELGADVDIGNINLLNQADSVIDPATEPTLSSIDSKVATESSLTSILSRDIAQIGGTSQTGADWTPLFQHLNVDLGTLLQVSDQPLDVSSAEVDVDINSQSLSEVTVKDRVFSSVNYGEDTVTSSGSPEALNGDTSLTIPEGTQLTIVALDGNSGKVYVGDSLVSSADGFPLDPKDSLNLKINDVSSVYIDVDADGDGVRWIVESV